MRNYTLETWSPEKGWTIRFDYVERSNALRALTRNGSRVARENDDREVRVVAQPSGIVLAWKQVSP